MAEEKNAMIRVKDLKKEFGDNQVLRGINYEIEKGQKIGTIKLSLDGKPIAEAPLVAIDAVEQGGFFRRLWDSLVLWWKSR